MSVTRAWIRPHVGTLPQLRPCRQSRLLLTTIGGGGVTGSFYHFIRLLKCQKYQRQNRPSPLPPYPYPYAVRMPVPLPQPLPFTVLLVHSAGYHTPLPVTGSGRNGMIPSVDVGNGSIGGGVGGGVGGEVGIGSAWVHRPRLALYGPPG